MGAQNAQKSHSKESADAAHAATQKPPWMLPHWAPLASQEAPAPQQQPLMPPNFAPPTPRK